MNEFAALISYASPSLDRRSWRTRPGDAGILDLDHIYGGHMTIEHQNGLADAAAVLDDLATGRAPDRARLLSGALALDTLQQSGVADRDLLDAAAGLRALATGGTLDLDETGRARAAVLAAAIRAAIVTCEVPMETYEEAKARFDEYVRSGRFGCIEFTLKGWPADDVKRFFRACEQAATDRGATLKGANVGANTARKLGIDSTGAPDASMFEEIPCFVGEGEDDQADITFGPAR